VLPSNQIELDLVSDGRRTVIRMYSRAPHPRWSLTLDDGAGEGMVETRRDPYEIQAEAFLDTVVQGDPGGVLSRYEDALQTDRLDRAIVSATGSRG